jgi:glycosyltransferase involved in cell wall biosynthesis
LIENPLFSIVIPSYNYGHYLVSALESIFKKQSDDVQVILVDDASTDNTSDIARKYIDQVDYIRNESNLGAGGAWRVGLNRAKGKFVIKLDADDELLPGHLDAVAKAFEADDEVGLVVASVLVRKENEGVIEVEYVTELDRTLDSEELRLKFLKGFFFRMPGCVLRRDILLGHQLPDPDLYQIHDWEFFLRVTKGNKARLLREPGGMYRVHGQSITATAQFDNRLHNDISRWLSIAAEPGERQIAGDEMRTLRGSCAELLLIGFGPKYKPSSYLRYIYKYFKAVGISRKGGFRQVLRMHKALATKISRKILGIDRAKENRSQP